MNNFKLISVSHSNDDFYTKLCEKVSSDPTYFTLTSYSLGEVKPICPVFNYDGRIYVFIGMDRTESSNDVLFRGLLALEATKRINPKAEVVPIIPYLPYSRQDKVAQGEPASLSLLLTVIKYITNTNILTWDFHTHDTYLRSFVSDTYDTSIIAEYIMHNIFGECKYTIVAPDQGAKFTADAVAESLKKLGRLTRAYACTKTRLPDRTVNTEIPEYKAWSSGATVVVDDIIDTGGTILGIINRLPGENNKWILVSHGILNTHNPVLIDKALVSNSIGQPLLNYKKVTTYDITSAFAKVILGDNDANLSGVR